MNAGAAVFEVLIRDAWKAVAWKTPGVDVNGQKKLARRVVIERIDRKKERLEEPDALYVWVNSWEMPSQPIELEYQPPLSWRLSNHGDAEVRVTADSGLITRVSPGESIDVAVSRFRVAVLSHVFNFVISEASFGEIQQPVSIEPLPSGAAKDLPPSACYMKAGDFDCCLLSPEGFWKDAETVRSQLLDRLWQAVQNDSGVRTSLVFQTSELPVPGPDRQGFRIVARIDGKDRTFVLFAPGRLISVIGNSARPPGAEWMFAIAIGYQDLSLRRVRRLRFGDVIVLENSSFLYETAGGRVWKLWMKVDGQFTIGEELSPFGLWEISMSESIKDNVNAPSAALLDSVPVRIHAVISSEPVKFSDLGKFLPGQQLPIALQSGARADIFINGKKMGTGKLVSIPSTPDDPKGSRLGLQVVSWDA